MAFIRLYQGQLQANSQPEPRPGALPARPVGGAICGDCWQMWRPTKGLPRKPVTCSTLFTNSLTAQDPRRQKLIAAVLDDFERLAREV
jgi:hypothetical protein